MSTSADETAALIRSLIGAHGRTVESFLGSLEHDAEARKELWAEVFFTAYQHIDQLMDVTPDQARRWLLQTARNHNANTARKAMNRRRIIERLTADEPRPAPSAEEAYFDDCAADEQELIALRRAWELLSDSHRKVLLLDAEGHDGTAIARSLGVSPAAARTRLMRARRAFLDVYEPKNQPL